MQLKDFQKDIKRLANPAKAAFLARFFKTGKGEYAEGDKFLGITVPESRSLAQKYKDLKFPEIKELLTSKLHEERLIALLILVHNFGKGNAEKQKEIYDFYLKHTAYINNWDLVDLSADKIVGAYLLDKQRNILLKLAKSKNLWERRIAIVSTYQFIKHKKEYNDTFRIAKILLYDKHDLIHKAVGWMLREVGKRAAKEALIEFLREHYKTMPRTMLRYSIEHFSVVERRAYIEGKI